MKKTRRGVIGLGILGAAGMALPCFVHRSLTPTLGNLAEKLRFFAAWVRPEIGVDGRMELHCGIHAVAEFAHSLPPLADAGTRIMAGDSHLILCVGGEKVRVVLHPLLV